MIAVSIILIVIAIVLFGIGIYAIATNDNAASGLFLMSIIVAAISILPITKVEDRLIDKAEYHLFSDRASIVAEGKTYEVKDIESYMILLNEKNKAFFLKEHKNIYGKVLNTDIRVEKRK